MSEFDKIVLVWRKGSGSRRIPVGDLVRKPEGKFVFKYRPEVENLIKTEGFVPYTEFQEITKEYNGNVLDIFAQRLIKPDRPDIGSFYKFWEVDESKADDKFYLLGKTQALLPTDNFEFLAEYHGTSDVHFLTEIAGLSKTMPVKGTVSRGDLLRTELEPGNGTDSYAVKVFKNNFFLGYIKRFHNAIFYEKRKSELKVQVKALEQNGIIKRIFVRVTE